MVNAAPMNGFTQMKKKCEKIMWTIDYWIINIKQYLNIKEIERN
jgi:hypothetical protein